MRFGGRLFANNGIMMLYSSAYPCDVGKRGTVRESGDCYFATLFDVLEPHIWGGCGIVKIGNPGVVATQLFEVGMFGRGPF